MEWAYPALMIRIVARIPDRISSLLKEVDTSFYY